MSSPRVAQCGHCGLLAIDGDALELQPSKKALARLPGGGGRGGLRLRCPSCRKALKLDRTEAEAVSPVLATASSGALFLQKEQQAATQESSEGNCKAISLAAMTAGGHRPADQGPASVDGALVAAGSVRPAMARKSGHGSKLLKLAKPAKPTRTVNEKQERGRQSPFDSLPDEVLELILVFATAETRKLLRASDLRVLLSLRRVCLRWSRLVLSPRIWRGCTLYCHGCRNCGVTSVQYFVGALRLLPALDTVEVWVCEGSSGVAKSVLTALRDSKDIEIRCIKLQLNVTQVSTALTRRMLKNRQDTLKELNLTLSFNLGSDVNYVSRPILNAVAEMKALQGFSIEGPLRELNYDFRKFHSLQRVSLSTSLSTATRVTLLDANKFNLREVDFGICRLPEDLGKCSLLEKVTLKLRGLGISELNPLKQLKSLSTLVITHCSTREALYGLKQFLDSSPLVPAKLHLEVTGSRVGFTLLEAVPCLGSRLQSLKLHDVSVPAQDLVKCLDDMPNLVKLWQHMDCREWVADRTEWAHVVDAWTELTAASLQVLHVQYRYARYYQKPDLQWVRRLKALRPTLEISTSCD